MSDITHQITEYCLEMLKRQLRNTLDAAPDYLTLLADQTDFDNERTLYLDAMHELRFTYKKVLDKMHEEIEKPYQLLITGTAHPEFVRQGGIVRNVTGASELEEKLALETMLNKAYSKSEVPMQSIARSLDGIMGTDWIKQHYNPLDPEFIIRAWVAGTHEMDLHSKSFLGLYALLDSELLSKINQLYDHFAHYLEGMASGGKKAKQPAPQQAPAEDDFEAMFGDIDNVSPDSNVSFSTDSIQDDAEELLVTTDEIIRKLTVLQSNRALDDSNYYSSNYLLDFRYLLSGENLLVDHDISPVTIGQVNDDILDMTKLMFSFIMDDYNIPDDIRYHVSRLQIPYLKLGLLDKSLFQNREHPGRLLLMELTQSINTWDPGHTAGIDQLLSEIIKVVDHILETFDVDTEIFTTSQIEFKAFLEGDTHIDDSMIERQKSRDSHFKKTDNARLIIEGTLADLCANKRIPPVVERILDEYWSKVLFIEYLKEGEKGQEYQELLETAKILIDSVQAKYTEADRKAMAKSLPTIVKRLKNGLNIISIASFESVDLFRELQQCHMEVLKERPDETEAPEDEVSEESYEAFKAEHKKDEVPWDRSAIEASMLEENIERSIVMSSSDSMFEDDNPNVIRQSKNKSVGEATTSRADREREIIDNELREARDAYEKALQEHQEKRATDNQGSASNDNDDFMTMFFQDPEFEKKQSEALHNKEPVPEDSMLSAESDMDEYTSDMDFHTLDDDSSTASESDDALSESESEFLAQEMTREVPANDTNTESADKSIEDESEPSIEEIQQPEVDETVIETPVAEDTVSELPQDDQEKEIINPAKGRAHGAEDSKQDVLANDDVNEIIERLKVGIWVDLYPADSKKVRAKIMAIVPTVGKYIFGDRSGKKLADYNRDGLYKAIREGRIRLTDVDTAYDKTLESVISNLRVMKKAEDE